jgi:hypothetical protein
VGEALQNLNRQISAVPVLVPPNTVLIDQARTAQELQQIQDWGASQQRWIKGMTDRIDEILRDAGIGDLAPAAGAPGAAAAEEAGATEDKPLAVEL